MFVWTVPVMWPDVWRKRWRGERLLLFERSPLKCRSHTILICIPVFSPAFDPAKLCSGCQLHRMMCSHRRETMTSSFSMRSTRLLLPSFFALLLLVSLSACTTTKDVDRLEPVVVTDATLHDTDDPAIWVHPDDPARSLVIGTDKEEEGALYVFDMEGRVDEERTVRGLRRPNNVDVEYGILLDGKEIDIAVTTERLENRLRVFQLPEMTPVDGGGLPVFEGTEQRAPMGIALYKRPADSAVFAIVSRKTGPSGSYLWQYRLNDNGEGTIVAEKVREFGAFSGGDGEIEAIDVDDALGYVYYTDEAAGIRKYHADPDRPDAAQELAVFGQERFKEDREGISIYELDGRTGYILVSDQQRNAFQVFRREGFEGDPHDHIYLKTVYISTNESDGSEVVSVPMG
ncbi:phytase, partial [bacterium]|nr:phytase [bacterium]